MKKFICIILTSLQFIGLVSGQDEQLDEIRNKLLDAYISEGLKNNHGLKQQKLDYTKNLQALKEARGLFMPGVSLNARYTVATGGRTIEFPVGDMLNPVYNTLNLLTASSSFSEIENQEFNFYRPKEHETKVSVVQPIFSSDLVFNYRIKEDYAEISRISVDSYKRELIKEITRAYYSYQQAYYLNDLADTTLLLVRENVRVSKSLFDNDMVTIDAVYRSEAELSKLEVQKAQTNSLLITSRAYFNFLLNRSLDEPIELMNEEPVPPDLALIDAEKMALEGREELMIIKQYQHLNRNLVNMNKGSNVPDLFGVFDYGFQGEDYRFTSDDDFILASLVLKWDLFQGSVNQQKVKQGKIEGEKLLEVYAETEQKIRLEVISSYYSLVTAYESVQSARKQERSASRAYKLIDRKYAEGQASLLELIDARTSMTSASANKIISQNVYFIKKADLDFAMGAIDPESYY